MSPVFGFVADDLTGASDVLAQAHTYGLDAVLVVGEDPLPTDADVIGIAGPARSLGGAAFDALVRRHLERMADADVEVLLYKVCSTFDSAPALGSIGRGIELLRERYPDHGPIPVAPAQPEFGRFTVFSDHYATHAQTVYRLDRHPVMSRHPSTPMYESDLRRILAGQLTGPLARVGEVHLPAHDDGTFGARWFDRRQDPELAAFVIDAVEERHLDAIAAALRKGGRPGSPALVVGAGGMMAALARTVSERRVRAPEPQRASGPVLAMSASASSVTAGQIDDALAHGWQDVAITTELLDGPDPDKQAVIEDLVRTALAAGRDVVVHTTRGIADPRYARGAIAAEHVGALIGSLAARMATAGLTRDIAVLGGDTSSHALTAMGVRRLRVAEQFVIAGPVCRTDDAAAVAGCRLLLKGGQVGPPDILRRFAGHTC